jgi:hypothetical protein
LTGAHFIRTEEEDEESSEQDISELEDFDMEEVVEEELEEELPDELTGLRAVCESAKGTLGMM